MVDVWANKGEFEGSRARNRIKKGKKIKKALKRDRERYREKESQMIVKYQT